MPDIQKLYEEHGKNEEDVVVLGVAAPDYGSEGSKDDIREFLSEQGYSYPVLLDEGGALLQQLGIYSFPTTFMIDEDGNVFGNVTGAISYETMEDIVKQTQDWTQE